MRFVTAVGLVAVLGWVGGADDKKDEKKGKLDPAALVGTWEIVSGSKAGQKSDAAELKKTSFTVRKDGTATLASPEAKFEFKYTLDAKADPAKIDFEITESPFGAGTKAPGIVKVDDKGAVTLAYAPMGGDRPAKFDDDKAYVFVLKKKDDKKAKD